MVELYGCYEENGKTRSCYQMNTAIEDGVVRMKTSAEMKKVREDSAQALATAIAEGRLVRDRVGRARWIKR